MNLIAVRRWWSETGKGYVLVITGIIVLSTGYGFDQVNFSRKLRKEYPVGSMLPVEIGGHTGLFEVEEVSGTSLFFIPGEARLYGTLHIEPPEGAKYLGASEGSLVVNWQYSDGAGETWFLSRPKLLSPSDTVYYNTVFNIRRVEAR